MSEAAVFEPGAPATLRTRWQDLKAQEPGLRARDAAARLGVSEAELVACRAGDGVVELGPALGPLLEGLPALGEVMALTRNEHAVHEKIGRFDNVDVGAAHALVVNRDIDLRLFMTHWRFAFAVEEEATSGRRRSLQFFDADGSAVHKIYLREAGNLDAYAALVETHRRDGERIELPVRPLPAHADALADDAVDVNELKARWSSLEDTHDFVGMLRELRVGRLQALRLAGSPRAVRVTNGAFERVLERAAADGVSIMCFVGNAGCIQIHTGPVARLKRVGRWFNVLDPGFNLHVDTTAVRSTWVVRKPTRDGMVSSLELYDGGQRPILQLFGERKPGRAELAAWTQILNDI